MKSARILGELFKEMFQGKLIIFSKFEAVAVVVVVVVCTFIFIRMIVTGELITTRIVYCSGSNDKHRLVIFGNFFLLFTSTCA